MNILLGRDSQLISMLFFCSIFLGGSLYGAVAVSSDDKSTELSPDQENPMVTFYRSKLPDYPGKFLAAACLAVERDPEKGPEFLQQGYKADLKLSYVKKRHKDSVLLSLLRRQCEAFKATYQTHAFWKRYDDGVVQKVIKNIFDDCDAVTPDDLLANYQADRDNLSRGYEYVFQNPVRDPRHRVSRLVQAMFLYCEQDRYYDNLDFTVKHHTDMQLNEDLLRIPSIAPLLNNIRHAYQDDFKPQFFCASVKIAEQQSGVSVLNWSSDEQAARVIDAYESLENVIGGRWKTDQDFAGFACPLVARIAQSSCFADGTFSKGTYGAFAARNVLKHFFDDLYVQHTDKIRIASNQKLWGLSKRALDRDYAQLESSKHDLFGCEEGIVKLYADRARYLHNIQQGMQLVLDWANENRVFQSQLLLEHDAQVDQMMEAGVAKYQHRLAVAQGISLKNIELNNLALQRRYFASMATFARRQQQQRDQLARLAVLQETVNYAARRQTINCWYRYAKLKSGVRALASDEAESRTSIEKNAINAPLQVRLSPQLVAQFVPGAQSQQPIMVRSYDPYCTSHTSAAQSGFGSAQ